MRDQEKPLTKTEEKRQRNVNIGENGFIRSFQRRNYSGFKEPSYSYTTGTMSGLFIYLFYLV
jgi:hypothetical protein